tara:strand:+ start:1275 stop:1595 length:321 start_codon:yes stop_codon:yes gene_type:complete
MKFEDLKWMIIRTIGLCILCLSIYQLYNLIEIVFSLLDLRGRFTHQYDDGSGSFISSGYERIAKPIYDQIWQALRELIFLCAMSYYFLKQGAAVFNLLSTKEDSND